MARIGVFVCHCGSNIAANVDCHAVAAAAGQMPGVVHATDYKYMCSEPGQKMIQEAISQHQLDRVVVASCSPRMHEPTFRRAVAAAGVNPYRMEMANLREHCSWVHNDRPLATAKAIEIVGMLVAKVGRDEALTAGRAELTKRLLVIGGGIAGIQAALDVANAGYQVTLVERTPTIGGKMAMLDKTFPTLDCSACILTPLMVDVAQHPNIELRAYAEVERVQGFVGNFNVTIRQKVRYVNHATCTGCGTCWGKCPTKDILSEFDQGLGKRTSIYIPFPQAIPNKPVIDAEHCRYLAYRRAYAEQVAALGLTGEEATKYKPVGPDGKKMPPCQICQKMCPTGAIEWDQTDRADRAAVRRDHRRERVRSVHARRQPRRRGRVDAGIAGALLRRVRVRQISRCHHGPAVRALDERFGTYRRRDRPALRWEAPALGGVHRLRRLARRQSGPALLLAHLLHVHGQAGDHAEGARARRPTHTCSTWTCAREAAATTNLSAAHRRSTARTTCGAA